MRNQRSNRLAWVIAVGLLWLLGGCGADDGLKSDWTGEADTDGGAWPLFETAAVELLPTSQDLILAALESGEITEEEFPKTSIGKIRKNIIRDEIMENWQND